MLVGTKLLGSVLLGTMTQYIIGRRKGPQSEVTCICEPLPSRSISQALAPQTSLNRRPQRQHRGATVTKGYHALTSPPPPLHHPPFFPPYRLPPPLALTFALRSLAADVEETTRCLRWFPRPCCPGSTRGARISEDAPRTRCAHRQSGTRTSPRCSVRPVLLFYFS